MGAGSSITNSIRPCFGSIFNSSPPCTHPAACCFLHVYEDGQALIQQKCVTRFSHTHSLCAASRMPQRVYEDGQALISYGERGDELFLIRYGKVRCPQFGTVRCIQCIYVLLVVLGQIWQGAVHAVWLVHYDQIWQGRCTQHVACCFGPDMAQCGAYSVLLVVL
eukprot:scaffold238427_cov24-Tisochrysis_lutea.AAC.1